MYEGCTGVKTGYTKRSGRCLVSSAERDGIELIAVTLNAPSDWSDHEQMLDLGFQSYERLRLFSAGEICETVYLSGGIENYITVTNPEDVFATVPKNRGTVTHVIELPTIAFAPIEKGERLGRIIFYLDGIEIARADLCARYDVPATKQKNTLERLLDFIGLSDLFK